jgi:hypothetical protein
MNSTLALGLFATAAVAIALAVRLYAAVSADHERQQLRRRLRRERLIAREREAAAIQGATAMATSLMRAVIDSHVAHTTRLEEPWRAHILQMAATVACESIPPTTPPG